jgi:hypothetical protein
MSKSCLTCHDDTCGAHGRDAPACEDWTTIFNGKQTGTASPFWVYIAGPLSDAPVGYLGNCADFHAMSVRLIQHGFCPLNAATDGAEVVASYLICEPLTCEQVQQRSLDWLRLLAMAPPHRTAVMVLRELRDDGEVSVGTMAEIALAEELGVMVVRSMSELLALRGTEW